MIDNLSMVVAEEGVLGVAQERELGMAQCVAEGVGYEAGKPFDNILENGNDKQELLHDKPEVVYNMKDQLLHTEEIAGKIQELVGDEMVYMDDTQFFVDMDKLHGIQRVARGWVGKPYGKEETGEQGHIQSSVCKMVIISDTIILLGAIDKKN